MNVTVPIQAIHLAPGSAITIENLSWQEFEEILSELGDHRNTRTSYYQGTLELMSPLARHERPHRIMAAIVTTLLDLQDRNWEDFGSTTFKRPTIAGVEPDTCFYVQHAEQVQGCQNMDLTCYPPPDLAIESDVTSRTTLDAYLALGVPEVWVYHSETLTIYLLKQGQYTASINSLVFPDLSLCDLMPRLVQQAIAHGTRPMLQALKAQLAT
ncbi:MAG: Uma2 family endonuclease [Thermosynechococcaceae cyanobacterium]